MSILLNLDSSTLAGNVKSDNFRVVYGAAIDLTGEWEIALLSARLWYSWYNISAENSNNLLRYSTDSGATWKNVLFPDGQYEVDAINSYLHSVMEANGDFFINGTGQRDFNIDILANLATLRVDIGIVAGSNYQLDLTQSNMYQLLGYDSIIVTATQTGARTANINNSINSLSIETDIVSGSYSNEIKSGVLWSFVPSTAPGTNIDINIINPVYVPISLNRIYGIGMRITDNLNRRVNLNGEPVTYLLHLRKSPDNSLTNDLLRQILEK